MGKNRDVSTRHVHVTDCSALFLLKYWAKTVVCSMQQNTDALLRASRAAEPTAAANRTEGMGKCQERNAGAKS